MQNFLVLLNITWEKFGKIYIFTGGLIILSSSVHVFYPAKFKAPWFLLLQDI